MHIAYKAFASKTNQPNKKLANQFINELSNTITPNENNLTFKVKVSNNAIDLFNQFKNTFYSDMMLKKIEKIDAFTLKTYISLAYISIIHFDDVKNGLDYELIYKLKTYAFLCEIARVINNETKNKTI